MQVACVRRGLCAALFLLFCGTAAADEPTVMQGSNRFYFRKSEDPDSTQFDGSLTSTTLYNRENGSAATGLNNVDNVSPVSRLFTDLRAQLDVGHIGGGTFDVRADVRGRYVPGSCRDVRTEGTNADPCTRFQSGVYSGNELDVRELFVRRSGDTVDLTFGRQYVLDLAATKIDGIRYERGVGDWRIIAFGGGAPSRVSRDIRDDYPEVPKVGIMAGVSRALAVAGGGGAAYRFENSYGAFGAVLIFPVSKQADGSSEKPRTFVTSNGYYRFNNSFDFYHYMVVDVTGEGGAGLTNLNAGVNFHPSGSLRTYLQATRVDTETLNIVAQSRLDNPGANLAAVQNGVEVSRIASDSVRGGVSVGLSQNRFELSTSLTLRRRPDIQLTTRNGMMTQVVRASEATDVTIQAVDRKSIGGTRLGATLSRSFGTSLLGGKRNLDRSQTLLAQIDASKSLRDGRADIELYANLVAANDETRGDTCDATKIETCYGSASARTIGVGGVGYFRLGEDWFALTGVSAALQQMSTADSAAPPAPVSQGKSILLTAFGRLAYKF